MFKNSTSDNDIRYHTPFVPTTTWQWPPASRSTRAKSSEPTSRQSHISLQQAQIVTKITEAISTSISTTSPFAEASTSVAYPEQYASAVGTHSELDTLSRLCSNALTSARTTSLCSADISSSASASNAKSAITTSANTLFSDQHSSSYATSNSLQLNTNTNNIASTIRTTIASSAGSISYQTRPSLQGTTPTLSTTGSLSNSLSTKVSVISTSTRTGYHIGQSATATISASVVSPGSSHVSSSVVIAAIALGSIGSVLLFALLVQLLRICCAKRRRLSPAEQELKTAQETTLHPLSAHARFSLVTMPVLPRWQTKAGSPRVKPALQVNEPSGALNSQIGLLPHPEQPVSTTGNSDFKELESNTTNHSTKVIEERPNDLETKVHGDLLLPPAIPSPWSWVSSRTSATSPLRFSFDSRGQRRRSDPFDLEGKGFDFNC